MGRSFVLGAVFGLFAGAGLVIIGIVVFAVVFASRYVPDNLPPPRFPAAVEPERAWRLQRLGGGEVFLADFREKVLFVNNWATWCAPCVREMPAIERLAERMAGEDMAFVIVSIESAQTVREFVEEKGWRLPIYVAETRPAFLRTDVIPSTFILDETRRVVFTHSGVAAWDAEASVEFLDQLLGPAEEP